MNPRAINEYIKQTLFKIDFTIDAVMRRGYDDNYEEFDDYLILLEKYEFRKLVTFEIYESYFYPKRHEFELQIITEIVDAIANSKPAIFIGLAALSGVVGNAVYDLIKQLIIHVISKFKKEKRLSDKFNEIYQDIEKIHKYFESHNHVKLHQIESDLDIEPQKLTALMKLLGYKCNRRQKKQIWIRPD